MDVKTKDPNLDEENYSIFDKSLSVIMHIQWAVITQLLLMIFVRVAYAPNEIWLLFCLISMGIGFVLFYFWPRMCLCDESQAESETSQEDAPKRIAMKKDVTEVKESEPKKSQRRRKSRGRSRSKKRTKMTVKQEPEIKSKSTFDYEFKKPENKQDNAEKKRSPTPKRRKSKSRSKSTKSDDRHKVQKLDTQVDKNVKTEKHEDTVVNTEDACKLNTEPTVIMIKVEPPQCNKDSAVEIQTNVDEEDLKIKLEKDD